MKTIAKWRYGDNALIQKVSFSMHDEEWVEEFTEFVSGKQADEELAEALNGNIEGAIEIVPVKDERGIYGYAYENIMCGLDKVEFWDCDEERWSEFWR